MKIYLDSSRNIYILKYFIKHIIYGKIKLYLKLLENVKLSNGEESFYFFNIFKIVV